MKVSETKTQSTSLEYINQMQKPNLPEKAPGAPAGKPAQAEDQVQISSAGKETQKIYEVVQQTPDLRMEKVEALQREVTQNQYQRDSGKVADKMVKETLMDLDQ